MPIVFHRRLSAAEWVYSRQRARGAQPQLLRAREGKRANGCDSWARWSHLLTWQLVTALGGTPVVLVELPSGSVCNGDSNPVP